MLEGVLLCVRGMCESDEGDGVLEQYMIEGVVYLPVVVRKRIPKEEEQRKGNTTTQVCIRAF